MNRNTLLKNTWLSKDLIRHLSDEYTITVVWELLNFNLNQLLEDPRIGAKGVRQIAEQIVSQMSYTIADPLPDMLFQKVEVLKLSGRAVSFMSQAGIEYVWQLVAGQERSLLGSKGFGPKSLVNVKEALATQELKVGTKFTDEQLKELRRRTYSE